MFGRSRSPAKITLAFVAACNARDSAALAGLIAPDVVFIDSRGGRLEGAAQVLAAVAQVNAIAPDLRVEIDKVVSRAGLVLLTGRSLTSNPALAVATQWSAKVRDGRLVEWQAFGLPSRSSLVGLLRSLDPDEPGGQL